MKKSFNMSFLLRFTDYYYPLITIRNSKEERQHNDQNKKDKWANKDLLNTTQKTKDQETRTPLKPGGELQCSGRVSSSYQTNISRTI